MLIISIALALLLPILFVPSRAGVAPGGVPIVAMPAVNLNFDWNRVLNIAEVVAGIFGAFYLAWGRFVKSAIHRAVKPLQRQLEPPPTTATGAPAYENLRTNVDDIRDRLNDISNFYRALDNRLHLAEEQRVQLAQDFQRSTTDTRDHVFNLESDLLEAKRLTAGVQQSVTALKTVMADITKTLESITAQLSLK